MKRDFGPAKRRLRQAREQAAPGDARHIDDVSAQIEAVERGDYSLALNNAWDDVALDIFAPPEFHWIFRARGIRDVTNAIQHNFEAIEEQRPEILSVITQADVVVLFGREQGRIRSTGQPYDVEFVHRFTFREGRLAAVRIIVAKAA